MAPLPVLFTHYGEDWLRGSENVLLDLLRHLDRDRIAPVVWCNAAPLEEACRGLGIPTYRSAFEFYFDYSSPRFAPLHYAAQVREAVRLVRRHDIRVLHANSAAPTQWLAPAAAWTGRPLLTHLHIGYHRRSRYALLLHQADMLVGVSASVTLPLLADGVPPDRIRTISNGIDPARLGVTFDLRARLSIPPDAIVVGSVGSLIRRKGHDLLLKAIAALTGEVPRLHLVVAGSGEEHDALVTLAASLGLEGRVHFVGDLPTPGDLYAAVDFCALATHAESFGLVLVEAAWFALASVATAVGGIPEVLQDEETGLLVPPGNVPALAAAVRRLARDLELRKQLGERARQEVERRFLASHMASAFAAQYEELAQRGRAKSTGSTRLRCYVRLATGSRFGRK